MRSCKTCRHTLGGEHCWGCNYSTGLHKWEPKPTTNADRIRSMTDEELAEFMQDVAAQGGIPLGGVPIRWIDWLKSPAGVDE